MHSAAFGISFRPHRLFHNGAWICAVIVFLITLLRAGEVFPAEPQGPFAFEKVVAIARESAAKPFEDPSGSVPDFLMKLDYDQWRNIRFRPEQSLWRSDNLPFEVQFFHVGFFYDRPVAINVVDPDGIQPLRFDAGMFDYGENAIENQLPDGLGFAGFRLHFPINRGDYRDEAAVFLGASYLRSLGKDQVFGLSARGLAVDTGLESGEEFPYFREFWLEKPSTDATKMIVYALLDSPSLTGAYQFDIRPGQATVMTIRAVVFLREQVGKLGLAPLTSMFFYGEETNQRPVDDFRPEVHDSDGLLIDNGEGEIIWRPVTNARRLFINSFRLNNPAGFGLLQRDMKYDHYQDPEASYNKRPSTWVKPEGDWGRGHVELIQIPTDSEKNDNIVAFWVPAEIPDPEHSPLAFAYELQWFSASEAPKHSEGIVVATRTAAGREAGIRRILVDFKGGRLEDLPKMLPAESPLEAVVTVGEGGEILEKQLFRLEASGAWRLAFQVKRIEESALGKVLPASDRLPPLELRAFIKQGESVLTEIWSYAVWP